MIKISLKNILAIIDSKKCGCKNKIAEIKYIDIKDLVFYIKYNTVSEISAEKDLNTLNELKKAGIITKQKNTLLNRKNY